MLVKRNRRSRKCNYLILCHPKIEYKHCGYNVSTYLKYMMLNKFEKRKYKIRKYIIYFWLSVSRFTKKNNRQQFKSWQVFESLWHVLMGGKNLTSENASLAIFMIGSWPFTISRKGEKGYVQLLAQNIECYFHYVCIVDGTVKYFSVLSISSFYK